MIKSRHYKELFEEIYNSGDEILNNTTGESFQAKEGEEFKQCWANTPTRKLLPKFWFVSQYENLLSVKRDRIQWIHKNKRDNSEKISYKFAIPTEAGFKNQNIEAHNLVGLVWGSESFGLAGNLLEEQGISAFGVNGSKELSVQGHHRNGDDTDNRPENIKFVTDKVHVAITKAPKPDVAEEKHFEYMDNLAEVICLENPNAITIVLSGDVYDEKTRTWSRSGNCDVMAVDSIKLSPQAVRQLARLGIKVS